MNITRSGERGIDFDILAGQDIQINSDLMDRLERDTINATGVPSVIMNYVNEADYAKTLVMANAKFVGRVVSLQMSLNPSVTELYKKLLRYTTNLPDNIINKFVFRFSPPKTLNNTNMMDLINNTDQTINYMVEALIGKNSTPGDLDNLVKDKLYAKLAKELLPILPWAVVEKLLDDSKNEALTQDTEKKSNEAEEPTEGV